MRTPYPNELYHHGVIGMKWGVRRYQNPDGTLTAEGRRHLGRSVSGNAHRVAAGIYNLNAKTYNKLGNKTLASMNKAAAKASLKKAEAADSEAQKKRDERAAVKKNRKEESQRKKEEKVSAKEEIKQRLKDVDPSMAKNKQTKRVAYDYHNLNDLQFAAKYQTTKKKFAQRYERSNGDTYSMGKRKAAVAAYIVSKSGPVPYIDLKNGGIKTIKMGSDVAAKSLAKDLLYSEAVTAIGYNKAEQKYEDQKNK